MGDVQPVGGWTSYGAGHLEINDDVLVDDVSTLHQVRGNAMSVNALKVCFGLTLATRACINSSGPPSRQQAAGGFISVDIVQFVGAAWIRPVFWEGTGISASEKRDLGYLR